MQCILKRLTISKDLVEDTIRGVSYLLVGYDVDVVEYAHRLIELLHLYRAQVQGVVELDPFFFCLILLRLSSYGRLQNKYMGLLWNFFTYWSRYLRV